MVGPMEVLGRARRMVRREGEGAERGSLDSMVARFGVYLLA